MSDTPKINNKTPNTDQNPIKDLVEILKDKELTKDDKQLLFDHMRTRFKHRRTIAYISLLGIFLFAGISCIPGVEIEDASWLYGFFASIIASYYGMSGFKPNS